MKKATNTEMQALYTAFDIYRRAAILAAMWTAFDPFGAVVYELRDLVNAAFGLREAVNDAKEFWNYDEEPNHPLRSIKDGKDKYETFRKHIKGIKGALLRLLRNKWIAREVDIEYELQVVKDSLAELEVTL
jgi:hypothetical protein